MTQDVLARIAASHPIRSRLFHLPDRGTYRTIPIDTPARPSYTRVQVAIWALMYPRIVSTDLDDLIGKI
jgi:hypothetical protein